MALAPGSRLGSYEVTALIGQGGMGEVYRAHDTKLGRDVALKVLPDLFADEVLMQTRLMTQRRSSFVAAASLVALFCTACSDPVSDSVVLAADLPLHLEDYLDVATIEGSEVPTDLPEPVEWRFDEPQPDWKPAYWGFTNMRLTIRNTASTELARLRQTEEALQLLIGEENRDSDGEFVGALYVDLPDLAPDEWNVAVEARIPPGVSGVMLLGFNLTEPAGPGVVQARLQTASPLVADGTVQAYLETEDSEWAAKFSPNGRWLAYQSNESGRYEIYVRAFPGPGVKWQVSNGGGTVPVWRADGKELFYAGTDRLMSVTVETEGGFRHDTPVHLFDLDTTVLSDDSQFYDAAPDGRRFLVMEPAEDAVGADASVTLVQGWRALLE